MTHLSPRQVHLDFHTSEHISDVAACFDAADFARTLQAAAISSITVFARCHHGWLYYDSARFPERIHPGLVNKNLLLEQVRALHAVGVRAPVYITVQWDYRSATTRPEWLIRKQDGAHEGSPFTEPGFYQSLCVNTSYVDFLRDQTREVMQLLGDELDGIFFDIVGIRPCWCAACRAEMKQRGVDAADTEAVRRFAKSVLDRFKQEMTDLVRQHSQTCTIFYNAGHVGPCTRDSRDSYSHFELESLPSGGWGYLHFPVTARYARKLGLDCLGMTGKFHTSWGDFHSLKNLAALEFECFRMLSFGFAASIGDQLEPNGQLNPATYRLIGQVYTQMAAREAWARPARPLVEAAVLTAESPWREHEMSDSILGAVQLLEELAIQFDIVDETMDLGDYRLVIVPEDCAGTPQLQAKLDAYVAGGGRILACHKGGLGADGAYPACYGARFAGDQPEYPDFIVSEGPLATGLEPDSEYVIYRQGIRLAAQGSQIIASARAPYYRRSGDRFCSHRYTPSAKGPTYPAALEQGTVILFAHPLFAQYRDNAPRWVKQLVANALDRLLPDRLVRHDGPSTVTVQLLEQPQQGGRIMAHILTYIPVRKSATIDTVEERTKVHNLTLTLALPRPISRARLVPEDQALVLTGCHVTIPAVDGAAIVELT
jgi:hypothetical protein